MKKWILKKIIGNKITTTILGWLLGLQQIIGALLTFLDGPTSIDEMVAQIMTGLAMIGIGHGAGAIAENSIDKSDGPGN